MTWLKKTIIKRPKKYWCNIISFRLEREVLELENVLNQKELNLMLAKKERINLRNMVPNVDLVHNKIDKITTEVKGPLGRTITEEITKTTDVQGLLPRL